MLKARTHILFVDDDARFRVVDILKRSGWTHTRRVADLSSIDDPSVQQAHILFVDIHGVGKKLGFQDEGLGLASAIMQNYPKKKVVIYSAQTSGERFHEAFRKAADQLAKNADPYEFQQCAERLAAQVYGDS
jgi:DNA-binding NtrC family response regulator